MDDRFVMPLLILDFFATWCEPCKWSDPIIEEVIRELGDTVELKRIDIDKEQDTVSRFSVRSVPTFVLLDGEQEIWRMNGFDTSSKMLSEIRAAIYRRDK